MNSISKDTIWHSKLDQVYICAVQRVAEEQGLLTIHGSSGALLHSRSVKITGDAKSGVDLNDLAIWQEECINFIDSQK